MENYDKTYNWNVTKVLETALSRVEDIKLYRDSDREDGKVNTYTVLTIYPEIQSSLEIINGIIIYQEDKHYLSWIEEAINDSDVEDILETENWKESVHIVFEQFKRENDYDDTEDIIRDFVEENFI
jgi:hypothetical protein